VFFPQDWTWGAEVEYADVYKLRLQDLPEELGKWEWAEKEICNTRYPYAGIAVDPKGVDPPVGGEINTKPTKTYQEQVDRILEITEWMKSKGEHPTASFTSPFHIHIHIPGLIEDVLALKNLVKYQIENQRDMVNLCYQYKPYSNMLGSARNYLRRDGGLLMPSYLVENIIKNAEDFQDFLRLYSSGKNGIVRARPFRYCINSYCLKWTKTVEFRCFRATLDHLFIQNAFKVCFAYMDYALNHSEVKIRDYITSNNLQFQPLQWYQGCAEMWDSYMKTKKPNDTGGKNREYWSVKCNF
jgi:hypothetical protein